MLLYSGGWKAVRQGATTVQIAIAGLTGRTRLPLYVFVWLDNFDETTVLPTIRPTRGVLIIDCVGLAVHSMTAMSGAPRRSLPLLRYACARGGRSRKIPDIGTNGHTQRTPSPTC